MKRIGSVRCRGVVVECFSGDILEARGDAVVNPANSLMVMGGGLAGYLKRRGGVDIEKEALKYAPVPVGKAVVTHAGRLPYRYVIHAPTMEKPAMRIPAENVYKATYAALVKAFDLGVKKLVLPGMGTGVGGLDPRSAAEAMVKAILDIALLIPSFIEEIIVVDLNPDIPEEICRLLREHCREDESGRRV